MCHWWDPCGRCTKIATMGALVIVGSLGGLPIGLQLPIWAGKLEPIFGEVVEVASHSRRNDAIGEHGQRLTHGRHWCVCDFTLGRSTSRNGGPCRSWSWTTALIIHVLIMHFIIVLISSPLSLAWLFLLALLSPTSLLPRFLIVTSRRLAHTLKLHPRVAECEHTNSSQHSKARQRGRSLQTPCGWGKKQAAVIHPISEKGFDDHDH